MALADSHSRLLSAIDDYGEFGRKQNRKEGVMRGLEMLNESLSAAMERRRRKKEQEQARLDRQAEIEQGRKDDQAKEQRGVGRELFNASVKAEEERLKKDAEKKEKEEAKAANLPKIQSINAKFKAAIQAKDDNAFADALEEYSYLDEDFQKLVPLAAHQKRFDKVMEPPPVPKPGESRVYRDALLKDLEGDLQNATDPKERRGIMLQMAAIEEGEAWAKIIEASGAGVGDNGSGAPGTGADAFTGSEMLNMSNEDKGVLSGLSDQKAVSPRVLTQMAIARDLGIPVDEEAVMGQAGAFVPVTAGARISKRKFAAVMEAYDAIQSGVYGEGADQDDPKVWREALDDAYENNGIPTEKPTGIKKSVLDVIAQGETNPADFEEAIDPEAIRKELELKYPDLYDLLAEDEDGSFSGAIDAKYGVPGLADYLSSGQTSNAY